MISVARVARVLLTIALDPLESVERIRERVTEGWERKHCATPSYTSDDAWERRLHELVGVPWPCPDQAVFETLWADTVNSLRARGLDVGRQVFGGWDDADPALARAAWCLTLHLHPERAVETGVARGLTTRFVLEAMERFGRGHLWSIDVPPMIERHLAAQTGAAVPEHLRKRWTYILGSSRRRLHRLLAEIGPIELFLHDSMHTTRNVLFELHAIWRVLTPGGAALIDDVDFNRGFALFTARTSDADAVVGPADDRCRLVGAIRKRVSLRGLQPPPRKPIVELSEAVMPSTEKGPNSRIV